MKNFSCIQFSMGTNRQRSTQECKKRWNHQCDLDQILETQASFCPSNPNFKPLASNLSRGVNGLFMYYFKSMNIVDNMERIVGLLSRTPWSILVMMLWTTDDLLWHHFPKDTLDLDGPNHVFGVYGLLIRTITIKNYCC